MTTNDDDAWVAALRGKSVANTDEAARLEAGELRRAMLDAHATRAAAEGSSPEELQRLLFRLRREQLLDAAELRPENRSSVLRSGLETLAGYTEDGICACCSSRAFNYRYHVPE
jgi:hypothetical protein